ncbi:MAG: insulinase family protein [Flavobacteriales bacterium]|nr:insulinase family protein [Flavobacteriales bacterium]MCB9191787.1 insulinase family protein [Flavobacteriales bacterium]
MLDRTQMPEFGKVESIDLIEPKVHHLSNGLPVFYINAGVQDVLKVELVFDTGTSTANKLLVGSSTVNLMKEGTNKRSAAEIAEAVDFYGSYLQAEVAHDQSSISLFTLNKHLKNTLPTLAEVYSEAAFPEREFETYVLQHQQEMLVNQQKVGYLGAKAFSAALYGNNHPYGRSAEVEDYLKLKRQDLVDHHDQEILSRIKYILVAGRTNEQTLPALETYFGSDKRLPIPEHAMETNGESVKTVHVQKDDAVQNAIRVGRILFNRNHSDFIGMQILCTVLGGYFGSRLMSNIREDKGYTYGIGAGMVSLQHSGYLTISTQVGSDVCQAALNEVYFEIERLRKELIPISELELVRNYMLGSILKSIDGPFHLASKWKMYLEYGLGIDTHHDLIHRIKTITPERLKALANQYLQQDDLTQVTAGQPLS